MGLNLFSVCDILLSLYFRRGECTIIAHCAIIVTPRSSHLTWLRLYLSAVCMFWNSLGCGYYLGCYMFCILFYILDVMMLCGDSLCTHVIGFASITGIGMAWFRVE